MYMYIHVCTYAIVNVFHYYNAYEVLNRCYTHIPSVAFLKFLSI